MLWKPGFNSYVPKHGKSSGNFGSQKDKERYTKFFKGASQIDEEKWDEIWLRSTEYFQQNGGAGDADSDVGGDVADSNEEDNSDIYMSN